MVVVGRSVDPLHLRAGTNTECIPWHETVIVTAGAALVCDQAGPTGVIARGGVIDHRGFDGSLAVELHAITDVRGFVIPRRELPTLATVAPRVADAVAPPVERSRVLG
jgi:hypothetical protein